MDETGNRERDQQGKYLPNPDSDDYDRYAMGARDPAARAAKAAYRRGERARASEAAGRGTPADEDKRTVTVTVRLSEREAAELDRRTGDDTRSAFTRDVLLAALGIEDAARRPTRRRRNYSERQTTSKQRGKGQQQ
jgi:hypothetical protein